MKELSLHILDIMHNSIAAKASLITLTLIEDEEKDSLFFEIKVEEYYGVDLHRNIILSDNRLGLKVDNLLF